MIIASQKRKENIAEYILYMWQIEDIIRANKLSIELIENHIINKYDLSPERRKEMVEWYESLIDMMRTEGVVEKGHLQINKNTIIQLTDLHLTLLKDPKYPEYFTEYYKTLPFIVELRAKAGDDKVGEIETCLTALYGTLLLRLRGGDISTGTLVAIKQISHFLALLSKFYKLDSENRLFQEDN